MTIHTPPNWSGELERSGDVQAIVDVALRSVPIEQIELADGEQVTVIRSADGTIQTLTTRASDNPEHHVRRRATHNTIESFIAYIQKWQQSGTSFIWDPTRRSLSAELDGPTQDDPTSADHTAVFETVMTEEWQILRKLLNAWVPREHFALAIDALVKVDAITFPGPATALTLAQHFNISRSTRFEEGERLQDGAVTLVKVQDHSATGGKAGEVDIPATFDFYLKPYIDSDHYEVETDMRWKLVDDDVQIQLSFPNIEMLLRTIGEDYLTQARAALPGTPLIVGAVNR